MSNGRDELDNKLKDKRENSLYAFSRGDNHLAQDSLGQIVYVKGRTKAEAALKEVKALAGFHLVPLVPLNFRFKSKNK